MKTIEKFRSSLIGEKGESKHINSDRYFNDFGILCMYFKIVSSFQFPNFGRFQIQFGHGGCVSFKDLKISSDGSGTI